MINQLDSKDSPQLSAVPQPFQVPFQTEGWTLPANAWRPFLEFYANRLRFVVGARSKARDVLTAYHAWAEARRAPSLSFWELRKLLGDLGHRRAYSNGSYYRDLMLLSLADPVGIASENDELNELLSKLDELRAGLASLNEASARVSRLIDAAAR